MREQGCEADTDAGFKRFMDNQDFNFDLNVCVAFRCTQPGVAHERGQDAVCASDGVRSVEDVHQAKLFHIGLSGVPARSTPADALNLSNWRIHHALAIRLIVRAKDLYVKEPTCLGLDATV